MMVKKGHERYYVLSRLRIVFEWANLRPIEKEAIWDAIQLLENDVLDEQIRALAKLEADFEEANVKMATMPRWIRGYD